MQTITMLRALAIGTVMIASAAANGQTERRVIKVNAERFAFTPSRIELIAGDEVDLRLRSDDTSHGFRITGLDTNVAIPKRGKGEITVTLKIDTPGTYRFECNRMCGAGHDFMRGEIVVRERTTTPSSSRNQERR